MTKRKGRLMMNERWGDNSKEHICCRRCGMCKTCGDCQKYGCGQDGKMKKPTVRRTA